MKNLIINLSLISTLLIGQLALAQDEVTSVIESSKTETIVITASPEVANFEIYSLKITEEAINSTIKFMLNGLSGSITSNGPSVIDAAVKLGSTL